MTLTLVLFLILLLNVVFSGCTTSAPTEAQIYQILTPINIALQNETVKSYLTGNWSINGVALNAEIIRVEPGKPEIKLNTPDVNLETDSEYVHVNVDVQNNTVVDIRTQGKRTNPCC
jgi:hypothetical protein